MGPTDDTQIRLASECSDATMSVKRERVRERERVRVRVRSHQNATELSRQSREGEMPPVKADKANRPSFCLSDTMEMRGPSV